MNEKEYDSIFSPKKKIDIASHITELILNNKIEWKNKKSGVDNQPRCDFWVKDKADKNPDFKELKKDFALEVSYVKNLLSIFSKTTVLKYVRDRGIITFRYLPLEKQKTALYNLFQEELKRRKKKKETSSETNDTLLNYLKRSSKPTNISGL